MTEVGFGNLRPYLPVCAEEASRGRSSVGYSPPMITWSIPAMGTVHQLSSLRSRSPTAQVAGKPRHRSRLDS